MNPNHLTPGHLLHQRYSIQRSLGQGGFGITYLAYDQKLEQEVCVKELFVSGNSTRGANMTVHSQTTGDFSFADFVQRFIQEARQLARFQHSNIVRVLDIFQENDTAYTVMEYVQGETLKQKVQREGVLTEKTALAFVHQLLDAVEEVHKKGMLHRDIKPDNLLVSPEGRVVLIDFGSARDYTEGKTTTQTSMLTPGFAPPEQYSNRAQRGTYTDIYALGATLYYMLTGEKPIAATDRINEDLTAPHLLNPKVSSQVASAVMLAMELRPENRFRNVEEMREAIKTLQKRKPQVQNNPPQKESEPPTPPQPKNRAGWYVLLAIAIVFVAYWQLSGPEPSPEEEQTEEAVEETIDTSWEEEQRRKQQEEEQRQAEEEERRRQEQEQQNNLSSIQKLQNDMVYVAGGSFFMGCTSEQGSDCHKHEKPIHQVTLSGFYISKYEVTQAQWRAVMGGNPSYNSGCDNCPVEQVSWNDVQEFIRRLNQTTGRSYRLPTEAEWEYAARGGNQSMGYKYSGSNSIDQVAWYDGNSNSKTHPVGQMQPNELGLYDMSGNVWEWCSDLYSTYSSASQTNPTGPTSGSHLVSRSGSWRFNSQFCRVTRRSNGYPGTGFDDLGFRLVSPQ